MLRRIEGEYREMPGMCVTAPQAQRLWGLDATTCEFVLRTLVERRILRRTPRGTFVKS
jgi:Fic family protein